MADRRHGEVVKALHAWGFSTRSDPTLPPQYRKDHEEWDEGRPDIMCLRHGVGAYVEVKNGWSSWSYADFDAAKRRWATTWGVNEPYCNPYYIWLVLGTAQPHWNKDKYDVRRAWLIPYHEFMRVEEVLKPYQKTIVYRAHKGMKTAVQEQKLDAINLFKVYELEWRDGCWRLPPEHVFGVQCNYTPAPVNVGKENDNLCPMTSSSMPLPPPPIATPQPTP